MSTSIYTRASAWAERSKFAAMARLQFSVDPALAGVIVSTVESCANDPKAKFVVKYSQSRIAYLHTNARGDTIKSLLRVTPTHPSDPMWAEVMLELKRLAITEALRNER